MEHFFLDYTDMEHGQYRLPRKCKCKNHRAQEKPRGGLAAPLLQLTIRYNSDNTILSLAVKNPRKKRVSFFLKKIVHVRTSSRKGGSRDTHLPLSKH